MCPSYYEMIRSQDPDFTWRYRMVQAALQHGIRPAARAFGCSRNTVRKWLRRYLEHGKAGLQEQSRAPKRIPHKTPAEVEQRVLEARDRIPCFGPQRLQQEFDLPCSTGAIVEHFRRSGVDLSHLVVQTDNGSEFGGAWNRRHGLPPLTKLLEQKYGCRAHRFNPPHRSTYNSDVETVHGLMEREFYELERFRGSVQQFLNQAYSYQLYFNLLRRNRNRGGATPEELRAAHAPTIDPKIYFLPPVLLSSLDAHHLPLPRQVVMGHDVPGYVSVRYNVWRSHSSA